MLLLGPCTSTGPPVSRLSEEQVRLIDQSFDAIQEEVAAARRPSQVFFILFVASLLIPLLATGWMLFRAERSAIGHDQALRTLVRYGAGEPVVRHYLEQSLDAGHTLEADLPEGADHWLPRPPRPRSPHHRRKRRRRGETRAPSDPFDPDSHGANQVSPLSRLMP